ncbi:MAG: hypothetical protein Q9174_000286 [Haloplaca sp. 1 TL-2023]
MSGVQAEVWLDLPIISFPQWPRLTGPFILFTRSSGHLLVITSLPAGSASLDSSRIRYMTIPFPQTRIIPPIRKPCHKHPQRRAHADIICIMPIVLEPRNRNHRGAYEWKRGNKYSHKIGIRPENMQLACEEQTRKSKSTKGETTMAAREAAPAVMEKMMGLLGANGYGDEFVLRCALCGFAAGDEVGSRATDGVLSDVGKDEGQEYRG